MSVDGKVRRSLEYVDEPYRSEQDKWYGIFEPDEKTAETLENETEYVAPVKTTKRRRRNRY